MSRLTDEDLIHENDLWNDDYDECYCGICGQGWDGEKELAQHIFNEHYDLIRIPKS